MALRWKSLVLIWILIFSLVILLSFLSSLLTTENTRLLPVKRLEKVTLQLKWQHQFQFAGYYAAKAQGYYQDAGLDVEILPAPEDVSSVDLVLRGKADFGIAMSDLLLLRGQGESVVALATIFQHSPLVFLAIKNSGIDHIHDLVGKKVMLESHSEELIAYLHSEGVSLNQLIQLPHDFNPLGLIDGRVDAMSAYSTDEPFLLREAGINYLTFTARSVGIDFYGDTLYTTAKEIRENPQKVRKFLDASLKGWEYALNNPQEIIALILTEYSQRHSREHLEFEAMMTDRLIIPDIVEIGYMNPGRWQHIAKIYQDLGMLSKNFSLEGFIYERNPRANLFWFYLILGIFSTILGLISWVAWRFYRLNLRIHQEIKERKQTEIELRALEKRYRTLSENAPFPVVISYIDNGIVAYLNPEAAKQFEIAREYVIGKKTVEFYTNIEERNQLLTILLNQGFIKNYEIELKTASDKHFWACLSATIIEFEDKLAAFTSLVDITKTKVLQEKLQKQAITDELTDIYNRRHFFELGKAVINQAIKSNQPLAILLIDLDHFKSINDTYGHDVGDIALKQVSSILAKHIREKDILGRLGGEEFALILPETTQDKVLIIAERLRLMIAQELIIVHQQKISLTVSIGIATLTENIYEINSLLKKADQALYQAKHQGRNCIVKSE